MSPADHHAGGRERYAPADRKAELADLQQLAARLAVSVPRSHAKVVGRAETVENTARFLQHVRKAGGLDAFLDLWLESASRELCLYDAYYSKGGAS